MSQLACELDQLLRTALSDEQAQASARGVQLEFAATPSASPVLRVDAPLVERAIANLVRNAVSVSQVGQVVRVMRTVVMEGDRRIAHIDVTDNGPGLPDEPTEDLFKLFHASRVPGADRPAGLGIGLPLAREVARAHGGELIVLSTNSSGTTFRFKLPLDASYQSPRPEESRGINES